MVDTNKIKKDFPIFQHHPNLVYLDTAASSQTPQVVLDAMHVYYTRYRANIHRGVYQLSGQATEMYESARKVAANFINADVHEIIFTSGATQGLNVLAYSLGKNLKPGDNIVLTRMEHHANLIPWQEMSKRYGFEIRFVELQGASYELDLESVKEMVDEHTKIVSFIHVSNTLGTINPAKDIIQRAKEVGAITIVDAAQSVPHMPVDVKDLDCDFLVFSGHKMYGPTGIGVLYGKKNQLEQMDPFLFGGDMIKDVTFKKAVWNNVPWKFEAGTPNIAGAIGLAAAIQYLEKIGWEDIQEHENELISYALEQMQKIPGLTVIGPTKNNPSPRRGGGGGVHIKSMNNLQTKNPPSVPPTRGESINCDRLGVISFTLADIHPHDIATILDEHGVAVRAGHHCTMPLMQYLGISGTTRVSLGIYTTKEDIDMLMQGLHRVGALFQE